MLGLPFVGKSQEGALNGYFSVNPNQKIRFSKGNLQFNAAANLWKFADNQYDVIGEANQNISATYDGWIDLFGWGTSGWNSDNVYIHPYDVNCDNGALYGPGGMHDLTGEYNDCDWGQYNPISNGGNQAYLWRTMSAYEWNYLCNVRSGAADKISLGTVNGIHGLILIPDTWTLPSGCAFVPNASGWDSNVYNSSTWLRMEQGGAVFLPASGRRLEVTVNDLSDRGYYHSCSYYTGSDDRHLGADSQFLLSFNSTDGGADETVNTAFADYRYYGSAVRLVRNEITFSVQATPNPEAAGYITGTGGYTYNSIANLTAHTNIGYAFLNWTENNTIVCTTEDYSFLVSGNRTIVANYEDMVHIVATSDPENAGVLSGEGYYRNGETVTLTQQPNHGYLFMGWYEDDQLVSENSTYSFVASYDRNFTAHYVRESFLVTAEVSPEGVGAVTGTGTYNYMTEATLTAEPTSSTHYFLNWTEDGMVVSTEANYTFTVTRDVNLTANFNEFFHVYAEVVPFNVGSLSGMGDYADGQVVTMSTAPYGISEFISWTENGEVVSVEPTFSFEIHSNRNLAANYRLSQHQLTLNSVPAVGGQTTGAGIYNYGCTATVTAIPSEGYHFVSWVENGVTLATTEEMTVVINGDRNITANFALNEYIINAYGNPVQGGTVSGQGTYQHGEQVVLEAVCTNPLYTFTNWTENGHIVSTEPVYAFTAEANRTLVGNFGMASSVFITTECDPENAGILTGSGTYDIGETATLKATPTSAYTFTGWELDGVTVCTNESYSFTVTGNQTYVAHFTIKTINITAIPSPTTGGFVTGTASYDYGATATVTATSNIGYTFANWTENGVVVSTQPEYSFTATNDRTLIANFSLGNYFINVTSEPYNSATIIGGGSYMYGDTVTVSAIERQGYEFVSWTEDGNVVSTYANYSFIVTRDRSLVANMSIKNFLVTTSSLPTAAGVLEGDGRYNYGTNVTVKATANEGFQFLRWEDNGEAVSTEAEYTFEIHNDVSLTAVFVISNHVINAYPNPVDGGSVTGQGTYSYGSTATLTAVPNRDEVYEFYNWTENGETVSTDATYSFTVTRDVVLTANFIRYEDYFVSISSFPIEGGITDGSGPYEHGATATVYAFPAEDYDFIGWMEGNDTLSVDQTYTFVVESNRHLYAIFGKKTFVITASANPIEYGFVSGQGVYEYGDTVNLVAMAQDGQTFCHWIENGEIVCTSNTYTFVANRDRNIVANFAVGDYYINAFAEPDYAGTVTGQGAYPAGQLVTMNATPLDGHTFISWEDNNVVVSTNREYSFIINNSRTLVANFTKFRFHVKTSPETELCGVTTGDGDFNYGDLATVDATAFTGYQFLNWVDEDGVVVSTDSHYSFAVTSDKALIAMFTTRKYVINVFANPEDGGTLEGGGIYEEGMTVRLTATPASPSYSFVSWTENGSLVSAGFEYVFVADSDRTLYANFMAEGDRFVSLSCNPENAGELHGAGYYAPGSMVTISVDPHPGYEFMLWKNADDVAVSYEIDYTFTIEENEHFTAVFKKNGYNVTTAPNNVNAGSTTGDGNYEYGAMAIVRAISNEGYAFSNWTENGTVVSNSEVYGFIVNRDISLVANFEAGDCYIHTVSYPENAGVLSGNGAYNYGDIVTVSATENFGYSFVSWTEDGAVVSTDMSYSFIAERDRTLTALFKPGRFYVEAATDDEAGSTTGTGYYEYGVDANVSATPQPGYTFTNWTDNDFVISTDKEYKFMVTNGRKVVANFISDGEHYFDIDPTIAGRMTITAVVKINGAEQKSAALEVGAFCGESNRGFGRCHYDEQYNRYFCEMTVSGNADDELQFRLYDHSKMIQPEVETTTPVVFVDGLSLGTKQSPHVLNFINIDTDNAEFRTIPIYPNPVERNEITRLAENVKLVEVFNVSGLKINELHNTDMIDGIMQDGLYILKITTHDDTTFIKKLIVK